MKKEGGGEVKGKERTTSGGLNGATKKAVKVLLDVLVGKLAWEGEKGNMSVLAHLYDELSSFEECSK
jgi:hypothetical protein